ncbi:MAG: ATP-binding protein [Sulfuricurvum sp.]|nr:ATP-binding protein [Sulfuricurvum sp.]
MKIYKTSITSQMVLSLVAASLSILLFGALFHVWYTLSHEKHSLKTESSLEAQLIADMTIAPLAFFDINGIKDQLHRLRSDKAVVRAVVYDANKQFLADYSPYHISPIYPPVPALGIRYSKTSWLPWEFGNLTITILIKERGQLLGYLSIEKKSDRIHIFLKNMLISLFLFSLVLLSVVYAAARTLSQKILQPILDLSQTAQEIADTNDYSIRVSHTKENEISSLYQSFNHLLTETQSLTNELEIRVSLRTKELENSLDTLQKAQMQMVQSEKMAALGNLVSGVAHEVNTPLGNALTGGSIILKESQNLIRQIQEGTLKKSTLEHAIQVLNDTATVMNRSLNQAADLIRSFKRISVDQSAEDIREFNLYHYLEEILLTFHNKLKKIPVDVTLTGDHELILKSYPGIYAQLISNFIQNSLIHAFTEQTQHPAISIDFEVINEELILTYADNGLGMNEAIKNVAFEPFTTTKRSTGGSGLGLNIIYNLITHKLKGKITIESEPMQGIKFTITVPLPLEAPALTTDLSKK